MGTYPPGLEDDLRLALHFFGAPPKNTTPPSLSACRLVGLGPSGAGSGCDEPQRLDGNQGAPLVVGFLSRLSLGVCPMLTSQVVIWHGLRPDFRHILACDVLNGFPFARWCPFPFKGHTQKAWFQVNHLPGEMHGLMLTVHAWC